MPDDKYNGLYIHQELVKGNWYGISSGPKPQSFTGNIDDDPESLRNKALVIASPSSSNGTFPTSAYGHECAILTTRYGEGIYLQNMFDTQNNIEYDRVYLNNSWRAWQRVTTEGDASSTAAAADTRSRNNETAIKQINTAIGGRTANPSITSRVSSNATAINSLSSDFNTFKNSTNNSITSLSSGSANDRIARTYLTDQGTKWPNKGVKVLSGYEIKDFNGDSVKMIDWSNFVAWGGNMSNSTVIFSNVTPIGAPGTGHEIHISGSTLVENNGWYAVCDSSKEVRGLHISYTLFIANQPMT